jgi:hypothetical protein
MRDLPDFKVFPSPLIYDMHKSFDAVCAKVGLAPDDRATALIVTKIVELANAGRRGDDLTVETLRFFEPVSLSSSAPRRPALERKCLTTSELATRFRRRNHTSVE